MNNIITQNQKNIKRYLPHEIKTRENAVKMYREIAMIQDMYVENIIYQGHHYGDGIKNMMEAKRVQKISHIGH